MSDDSLLFFIFKIHTWIRQLKLGVKNVRQNCPGNDHWELVETGSDVMGFSLEAMVAIPCCLTILAHTSGLVVPLSKQVRQTADITAFASLQTQSSGYTCRHMKIKRHGFDIPVVETSPQRAVEAISLTRDLIATIRSPGTAADGQEP